MRGRWLFGALGSVRNPGAGMNFFVRELPYPGGVAGGLTVAGFVRCVRCPDIPFPLGGFLAGSGVDSGAF